MEVENLMGAAQIGGQLIGIVLAILGFWCLGCIFVQVPRMLSRANRILGARARITEMQAGTNSRMGTVEHTGGGQ